MTFWNCLPSYIGPTRFSVELHGGLTLPKNYSGGLKEGDLIMNTYLISNPSNPSIPSGFVLSNELHTDVYNHNMLIESPRVYFLPWLVDGVTSVNFETLKSVDYFATSAFSGCRFVVTEYGVAHVAWSAGGNRNLGIGSQSLRDGAEYNELQYNSFQPMHRRKLSFTGTQGTLDTDLTLYGTDNSSQSYESGKRAMVFGYRDNYRRWCFKLLHYNETEGSGRGIWSNFI
jgi:hypothetical protein